MLIGDNETFSVFKGDCIPHMHGMERESVDMSVYSPPFPSLYAYTDSDRDIGNSENLDGDAKLHLSFFFRAIFPIIKPGRVMAVHCAQIARMKRSGGVGLYDFRGLMIRLGQRAGFTYQYDWMIRKNPQAQAIRTRSRNLQFAGLESDRANTRGTLGDYIIIFLKPGENRVPIDSPAQVSRNQWIDWAECCWMDIRETDTLNVADGRGEKDTKHICPLQLGVIDRLIRLYSNPGEIVFSPFAGIGSELYTALKLGRRAYGCELKDEYYAACVKNLANAKPEQEADLFAELAKPDPSYRDAWPQRGTGEFEAGFERKDGGK